MTAKAHGRSRFEDLKRISLLIGITIGIAAISGGVYRGIVWAAGLQSKTQASIEHAELLAEHDQFETKEHAFEHSEAHNAALVDIKEDLKVLRQRTWELLQQSRDGP